MNNIIKNKKRFLIFDLNSVFSRTIDVDMKKEINIKEITKDNLKLGVMPIIDAMGLLEEKTKVVYNIEADLIGTPSIISLIEGTIQAVLKYKNKESGRYLIIIFDDRNISNSKLAQFQEEGKSKDIDIVVINNYSTVE